MIGMQHGSGPAPMEGQGAYNRSSRVQAAGLARAIPLLEQGARAVPLAAAPEPVTIADYGSSEGRNSLLPMNAAIAALRQRIGPDRAISVVHTDVPANDFSALFRTLETDQDSYLKADRATFALAAGRSFYEQLLPAGSVTLGWSSWAVQWLSETPAQIPDQIQVAYSRDATTRAAFARQAAADWKAFLSCRGAELRPGGRLVVVTMALTDAGDFGYRGVLDAMYAGLTDLVADGELTEQEVRRMAIATVGRSRADIAAPFAGGTFAGLSLDHLEIFEEEDRIWERFEQDHDAAAFGAAWAAFSRASVFPTLALGLDPDSTPERRAAFATGLEARMAARLAAAPEPMLIPLASAVLVKE